MRENYLKQSDKAGLSYTLASFGEVEKKEPASDDKKKLHSYLNDYGIEVVEKQKPS